MATDHSPVRTVAPGRHETFVSKQLARAEQRIRALDLTTAGLGFLAGTCAYAAAMIAADRLLAQAEIARQLLFLAYLVGAALYLTVFIVKPLRQRINPFYAAKKVEQTLPGSNNSVVNWVDLQNRELPAVIRVALGQRAAKDLAHADLERAVSGQRAGIAGGIAAACLAVLIALLLTVGGGSFFASLLRAFAPFRGSARTSLTRLVLLKPEAGDINVQVGRSVTIAVEVEGKLPDPKGPLAVRLLYQYQQGAAWLERPLLEEAKREFAVTLSAAEVQTGFWYKVAGGDAETPEYRVGVRSTPQLVEFQATYQFPKYAAVPKETRRERTLRAVRGTEVTVWALTNRTVKDARLDFEGKEGRQTFVGERVAGDAQAFQVRLPLKESGLYRLNFTSAEGDSFGEMLYPVEVLPDMAPEVQLTKPGRDSALPSNGLLALEGRAADDFGVRELTLQFQIEGKKLKPKPYRSAEKLQLPGGGYPLTVSYQDRVDLTKLEGEEVAAVQLQPGTILEYWLEAADACEPQANIGASKHYFLTLTEPDKNETKQKQERNQAQKDQEQHEKKQDEQLQQEAKERQEKAKEADKQEEQRGRQSGERGNEGKKEGQPDPSKQGGDTGEKNEKNETGASSSEKNGGTSSDKSSNDAKQDADQRAKADKLKDALQKNQGNSGNDAGKNEGNEKGANKPDKGSQPGQSKPDSNAGNDGDKPSGQSDPAKAKPEGQQGKEKAAEAKNEPNKSENNGAAGAKDAGKPEPMKSGQGQDKSSGQKDGDPMPKPGQQPAQAKERGQKENEAGNSGAKEAGNEKGGQEKKQSPGEGKPSGKGGDAKEPAGQPKPEGNAEQKDTSKSEAKNGSQQSAKAGDKKPGDPKGKPEQANKGDDKPAGMNETASKESKAAPKNGQQARGDNGPPSSDKPAQPKGDAGQPNESKDARAEAKPDGKQDGRRPEPTDANGAKDAKSEDVQNAAKDLQSDDPNERAQAEKKLEQMSHQASDRQAREEASKALQQQTGAAKEKTSEQQAKGQPQTKDGQPCAECKNAGSKPGDGSKPGSGKPSAGKDGSPGSEALAKADNKERGDGAKPGDKPDAKPGNEATKPGNGGPGGKKEELASAKDRRGKPTDGDTPGEGNLDASRGAENSVATPTAGPPAAPEKGRHRDKNTTLQLEDLDKVTKKELDAANLTEKDLADLRAWLRDQKRKAQAADAKEAAVAPQRGGPNAAIGGKRVEAGTNGQPNDLSGGGRALPPPGYRNANETFKRLINKPDADKP